MNRTSSRGRQHRARSGPRRTAIGIAIGLVAVVAASLPLGGAAAAPGTTRQYSGAGPVGTGEVAELVVTGRGGVPASGVGAVALNVTATNPSTASYLTVWPTGAPMPLASNLNFTAGQTVPNMVIATVGAGGRISLF